VRWRPETVVVLLAAAAALAQPPPRPIGEIEFFGHRGLDVESVRAALPIREGDTFPSADAPPDELKGRIGESVRRVLARSPTDVSFTCCDDHERWMVYLGLPGESYRAVRYHAPPTGSDRLPPELVTLDDETEQATQAAIMRGDATEDDSQGFALGHDPALRAKQLALREYALRHEALLLGVLARSSDARHRAIAARALGYARRSERQIAALVSASLDADDGVRNDAVRALAVLAGADLKAAKWIPPSSFVSLLASGLWSDHNKGAFLLESLSRGRDPQLLALLRAEALPNLVEMARWRSAGHAAPARLILGRIAGIEESRLTRLVGEGRVDEIVAALGAEPRVRPDR